MEHGGESGASVRFLIRSARPSGALVAARGSTTPRPIKTTGRPIALLPHGEPIAELT